MANNRNPHPDPEVPELPSVPDEKDADYPSAKEIMDAAERIRELAVKKMNTTYNGFQKTDWWESTRERLNDTIHGKFIYFTKPDPAAFDANIKLYAEARDLLNDINTEALDTARSRVDAWEGKAADAFHDVYFEKMPKIVLNQRDIAQSLEDSMKATKNLVIQQRRSIMSIAESTIETLESLTDSDGKAVQIMLFVVAAVVAVASGVGGLAGGLLAGVSVGASSATAGVKTNASDPRTVIDSMDDAIADLKEKTKVEYDTIRDAFKENTETINGSNRGQFLAPRPDLDSISTDSFRPES